MSPVRVCQTEPDNGKLLHMAKLTLWRKWFSTQSTIGELYVGGIFECFTLEDRIRARGIKIYGRTAIPEGVYPYIIDYSQRFARMMPHILNVPGFSGVRIHPGNTAAATEGCILVGLQRGVDRIISSRLAYDALFLRLVGDGGKGEIEIANVNPPAALLN